MDGMFLFALQLMDADSIQLFLTSIVAVGPGLSQGIFLGCWVGGHRDCEASEFFSSSFSFLKKKPNNT
jgi:hypothetical protein